MSTSHAPLYKYHIKHAPSVDPGLRDKIAGIIIKSLCKSFYNALYHAAYHKVRPLARHFSRQINANSWRFFHFAVNHKGLSFRSTKTKTPSFRLLKSVSY